MNSIVVVGNFNCRAATICFGRNGEIGLERSLYPMCTMTLCIVGILGRSGRFSKRSAHLAPDWLMPCVLAGGMYSLQHQARLESPMIRLVIWGVMWRLCHWPHLRCCTHLGVMGLGLLGDRLWGEMLNWGSSGGIGVNLGCVLICHLGDFVGDNPSSPRQRR